MVLTKISLFLNKFFLLLESMTEMDYLVEVPNEAYEELFD